MVFREISRIFRVFDELINYYDRVVVAYSGGKDSTMLSLVLYDWITSKRAKNLKVLLANSDTLSEIPAMREWTLKFMRYFTKKLRDNGVNADYAIYVPKAVDTFYWRVIVKGYPAPTFKFRWCVYLLKRKPAMEITKCSNSILLLGHRDEESPARVKALKTRLCPLSAGKCSSYYFQIESNAKKSYPIRDLTDKDIWSYLKMKKEEFDLGELFKLYGYGAVKARYGCWHCTLVKKQIGHYILGEEYSYLEILRLMYRWISDIPQTRAIKNSGYSRLGYILTAGRSIVFHALTIVEKLSGLKLYGLDEAKIGEISLREIFYTLDSKEADRYIHGVERVAKIDHNDRLLKSVEDLRYPNKREMLSIMEIIETRTKTTELREYAIDVLNELEKIVK